MKYIGTITDSHSKNAGFALLLAALATGSFIGALYRTGSPEAGVFVHQYFLPAASGYPLSWIMRDTFLSSAIFLAAVFMSGLSVLGQVPAVIALIYRSAGIGYSAADMYVSGGVRAIFPVCILLLPYAAVNMAVAVLSVREALRYSAGLFGYTFSGENNDNSSRTFNMYCLRYFILLMFSLFASVVCTVTDYLFEGLR